MSELKRIYSRNLTLGNLCDLLAEMRGSRPAWRARSPLLGRSVHPSSITYRELRSLVNRFSVTLIGSYLLRKGERVLILCSRPFDSLIASLAVIRAGGLAVPLGVEVEEPAVVETMRNCQPALLVTDRLASGCPHPLGPKILGFFSLRSVAAIGGGSQEAGGLPSLEEDLEEASDFFLPYTLKPQDVVALAYSSGERKKGKGTMITSRGVISACRLLYPLLRPLRSREGKVSAEMRDISWLIGAVSLLMAGMPGVFAGELWEERNRVPGAGKVAVYLGRGEETRPAGPSGAVPGGPGEKLRPVLWLSPGPLEPRDVAGVGNIYNMLPIVMDGPFSAAACGWLALRAGTVGGWGRKSGFFMPLPNLRYAVATPEGVKKRGRGELLVKGRPVTHGLWNDMEGAYRMLKDGWLHTGMEVRRNRWGGVVISKKGQVEKDSQCTRVIEGRHGSG